VGYPAGASGTSAPWQFEFNGLVCGQGTDYEIQGLEGLDLPPIRTADLPRPLAVGELMGQDFMGGRDITVELDVAPLSALPALKSATAPQTVATEYTFWFQTPVLPHPVGGTARVRKRSSPIDVRYVLGGLVKVSLLLHSTDPALYEATTATAIPWFGSANLTSNGDFVQYPIITLTGPLTLPSVINNTVPGAPDMNFATLGAGQTLVVDMRTHLLTVNGVAAPQDVLASSLWWWLLPGVNNIGFSSTDGAQPAGSGCSITYATAAYTSAT